jgi:hypothetical protein
MESKPMKAESNKQAQPDNRNKTVAKGKERKKQTTRRPKANAL